MRQPGAVPPPPHPPGPRPIYDWLQQPTVRTLVAALVVGVCFDVAIRAAGVGAATTVLVVAATGGAFATGWIRAKTARSMLVAACGFGLLLSMRDSTWLVWLNTAAIVSLGLGAMFGARSGSLFDLRVLQVVMGVLHAGVVLIGGLVMFVPPIRSVVDQPPVR